MRKPPKVPCGETSRCQFRLAVPRRHQEHQTVDLSALDPFQLLRDLAVNMSCLVARIGKLSEPDQALLRFDPPPHLDQGVLRR